jgi:hypothetical protein
MTDTTIQNPGLLRRAMTYLYTFALRLDYTDYDETADRMNYALGRIRELEREVAKLKDERSHAGVGQNAMR